MAYPWENDQWYLAHKQRWDALEAEGWRFQQPQPVAESRRANDPSRQ